MKGIFNTNGRLLILVCLAFLWFAVSHSLAQVSTEISDKGGWRLEVESIEMSEFLHMDLGNVVALDFAFHYGGDYFVIVSARVEKGDAKSDLVISREETYLVDDKNNTASLIGAFYGNKYNMRSARISLAESQNILLFFCPSVVPESFYIRIGKDFPQIAFRPAQLVNPLLMKLKDEKASVRAEACRSLGLLKSRRSVQPLISALKDKDKDVREAAANALGEIRDNRATDSLIASMSDSESEVVKAAISALGKIGDTKAVDHLLVSLKSALSDVRAKTVKALDEMNDPQAVEPLCRALADEDVEVRGNAAEALGKLNDKRAVESLISALTDRNAWVKANVADALAILKDSRAIEPLINSLDYRGWGAGKDLESAAKALKELTGEDYGIDRYRWQEWWKQNKERFRR